MPNREMHLASHAPKSACQFLDTLNRGFWPRARAVEKCGSNQAIKQQRFVTPGTRGDADLPFAQVESRPSLCRACFDLAKEVATVVQQSSQVFI